MSKPSSIEASSLSKELQIWIILGILALIWGSSFILMDRGLDAFQPLHIGALRMVVAALCLLPFCIPKIKEINKKNWIFFPIVGLVGNGIPAFLFPLAEQGINSATAGILNSLTSVFALIFGVFFGVVVTQNKVIGVILGLTGAALVTVGGHQGLEGNIMSCLLVVFATALYGISVNVMKKYLNDVHPISITGFCAISVAVPYGIYLLFSDAPAIIMQHPQGLSSLGYVAILGALGTGASSVMFYRLVQMTDAVRSSSVTYLMPIIACLWGFLRPAREDITLIQIAGMFVILVGVWLVNKKQTEIRGLED